MQCPRACCRRDGPGRESALPRAAPENADEISAGALYYSLMGVRAPAAPGGTGETEGPATGKPPDVRPAANGALPPRTRLEYLLDPGTAFLETGQQPDAAGAPITGVGRVAGRLVAIAADGGPAASGEDGSRAFAKFARIVEIARWFHLPLIFVVGETFLKGPPVPATLVQLAAHTRTGSPTLAAVLAPPAPAGAQAVALADTRIATPAAETGSDLRAVDDAHAIHLLRNAVALLPARAHPGKQTWHGSSIPSRTCPIADDGQLLPFRHSGTGPIRFAFVRVEGMAAALMQEVPDTLENAPAIIRDAAAFLTLCSKRRLPVIHLGAALERLLAPASDNTRHGTAEAQAALLTALGAGKTPWICVAPDDAALAGVADLLRAAQRPFLSWATPGTDFATAGADVTLAEKPATDAAQHGRPADGIVRPDQLRRVVALTLALAARPEPEEETC